MTTNMKKTIRHTLAPLALALLAAAGLASCQDDYWDNYPTPGVTTKADGSLTIENDKAGALQQQSNGYWVATRRVPLTGVGRVADDIGQDLVKLLDFETDKQLAALFDENLENSALIGSSGGIGASLGAGAGVSIKDLYHTYKAGQTVGFVVKNGGGGLLSVDVVKTFFIETYLNDVKQETLGNENATETSVLSLDLIQPANSNNMQTISATTTMPFDEIRLCFGNILSGDVLSQGMEIYYGFVGDNPAIPITKKDFPNADIDYGGMWGPLIFKPVNLDNLLDEDEEGPIFAVVDASPSLDITLGESENPIPGGSEVGFRTYSGGVLGIELFKEVKVRYTGTTGSQEEATITSSVAGISALEGGYSLLGMTTNANNGNIKKVGITFNGLKLDLLKGTTISYAYYREPIETDPSFYFGVGDDRITAGNSYILPLPKAAQNHSTGNVEYACLGGPALATVSQTEDGRPVLIGMTVDGDYKMQALYTAPDGKQILYNFTITRETTQVPTCHQPITVGTYPKAQIIAPIEATGCLLCIGDNGFIGNDTHSANNVIDVNTNNYAGSEGQILSLANNSGIVTVDVGENIPIKDDMRVGFVMQTVQQFLDLGVLHFFRIRVLDENEQLVSKDPTSQNAGVGLGLLAGAGDKIRYSVELDKSKGDSFRYIELYKSGILDVPLSALRIYYPFWEDAGNDGCQDLLEGFIPGDACITMLSAQQNHADIDYLLTSAPTTANLLEPFSFTDLSKVIDNDRNSYGLSPVGVDLGGATNLGIKFDPLTGGQSVGVILEKPSGLADANVLTTNASLTAYHDDEEIAIQEGNIQVLSLQALGNGDRYALEIDLPEDNSNSKPCNRLQITFNKGLLNALENVKIYGFYYRADRDGDGIPDCSEEPEEDMPSGVNLDLRSQDLCVGDPLEVQATLTTGAPLQEVFYLQCNPTTASNPDAEEIVIPVSIVNGKLQATESDKPLMFTEQQYGVYSLRLYRTATREADGTYSIPEDEQQVNLYVRTINVHGELSTWTGQSSSDWNDWSNWNGGVPWHCTNVIIPGGRRNNYPVLAQDDNAQCHYLQLEDGAQLVNSFYLTYSEAWVDIALQEGRYCLHSAPLSDMVSGYRFIAQGEDLQLSTASSSNGALPFFTALNNSNYPEQRLTPRIYQRLWSKAAPVVHNSSENLEENNNTVAPDETHWTQPYNGVAHAYGPGQNFSLMVGNPGDKNTHLFRFPKTHTLYHYYGLSGEETGQTESISRDNTGRGGHFVYETTNSWKDGNITISLAAPEESTLYLGGNPFPAHVNIQQLMTQNGINEIKVYDGNEHNTLVLADGQLLSSTGNAVTTLKPYEAFFVAYGNNAANKGTLSFNANMLGQGENPVYTRSAGSTALPKATLRLHATLNGQTAHALLRVSASASAAALPGEDTKLLVEGEARPAVAVYTVADGRALDIQQVPQGVDRIPLGFYLPDGGEADIRFRADFTDPQWHDWWLQDLRTGQRQRLTTATITLKDVRNGSGQYVLVRR